MSAHQPTTKNFKQNVRTALANENLQAAIRNGAGAFITRRATARARVPEFDDIRDSARI